MKTIEEYSSGKFDEELNVLVAEARGWKFTEGFNVPSLSFSGARASADCWIKPDGNAGHGIFEPPLFSTSLDACRELLADLTVGELYEVVTQISLWDMEVSSAVAVLRATARQICVAYLIVKGVLK